MNEYMNKYIKGGNKEKSWVSLNLGETRIQEWIDTGKFAHLKKELQIYYNLEFGCLKNDGKCHYIFFAPNKNMFYRINHLLDSLMDGIKIPLMKCSINSKTSKWDVKTPIDGQYNACPLF